MRNTDTRRERTTRFIRGNALGLIAIFIVIGGTATALPSQIRSKDIANGSVKRVDLAPNAVNSSKVAPDSLTGADMKEGSLDFGDEAEDEEWLLEEDPEELFEEEPEVLERRGAPGTVTSCEVLGQDESGAVLMRCLPG